MPLPFFNDSLQYQLNLERNSLDAKLTEEIIEYFDGLDNIGISINTLAGIKTYNYGYFKLNELLLIESNYIFTHISFSEQGLLEVIIFRK